MEITAFKSPESRTVRLQRSGNLAQVVMNDSPIGSLPIARGAHIALGPSFVTSSRLIKASPEDLSSPLVDLYSNAVRDGRRDEMNLLLKDVFPGLQHLEVLTENGTPELNLVAASGAIPVDLAGDGVRTLVRQALELVQPAGSVALLEEPEAFKHPAVLRQVAKAIVAAIPRGIQVLVATQSLELIDHLLSQAQGTQRMDATSVFRLKRTADQLEAHRLTGDEALFARTQIEEDLR